jgi:hypothetical protein
MAATHESSPSFILPPKEPPEAQTTSGLEL